MDRFIPSFCSGKLAYACLSMTDEVGGADSENPLLGGAGIKTMAKLEGNEYVINGSKAWPTHSGIAECYLTVCTTDPKVTQLWLGGQQICRYRVARGYYDLKNWA